MTSENVNCDVDVSVTEERGATAGGSSDTGVLERDLKSLSALLARQYKAVEVSMFTEANISAVINLHSEIKRTHHELCNKQLEFICRISDNEDKKRALSMKDRSDAEHKEMNSRIIDWLRSVSGPGDTVQECGERDGSVSSASSTLRRELQRQRKLAELKIVQLQEKHKFEIKQRELTMQQELKELQFDVERVKIEESFCDDDGLDQLNVTTVKQEDTNETRMAHLHTASSASKQEPGVTRVVADVTTGVQTQGATEARCNDGFKTGDQPQGATAVPRENDVWRGLQTMASTIQESFNLPKPDILTFSGNPADYCKFIKNFETNIESRVDDARLRLSYLIQYCEGEAKRSIEDCVVLSSENGYNRAKSILATRYGKPHLVARSHVDRLVNGPNLKANDVQGLLRLSLDMEKCQITLSEIGFMSDINSSENMRKIVKRLPIHLRSKWVEKASSVIESGQEPNFDDLLKFVQSRALVANTMYGQDLANESKHAQISNNKSPGKANSQRGKFVALSTSASGHKSPGNDSHATRLRSPLSCVHCKQNHRLIDCSEFKLLDYEGKIDIIRKHGMCMNCLNFKHFAKFCRKGSCCDVSGCTRKHHTMLHRELQVSAPSNETFGQSNCCNAEVNSGQLQVNSGHSKVCLRIVPIVVMNESVRVKTYAILDNGSDVTLCSNSLVRKLKAQGTPREFTISTVNKSSEKRTGVELCELEVSPIEGNEIIALRRVWSVEKLPISLKSLPDNADVGKWDHLRGISLPTINSGQVELLIGSDTPEAFWVEEERRGNKGEPYAVRSLLGWTIIGPTGNTTSLDGNVHFQQTEVMHQLQRLWTTDFPDYGSDDKVGMSQEDRRALSIMQGTKEKEEEHYIMGLPWRDEQLCLPNNKVLAATRLEQLKRKLTKDSNLRALYIDTMRGYIEKGYARPVENNGGCRSNRIWYLPHHPVCSPNKPGKVRIVFDCAAKYKGTSLNDNLLQGPDLVNSLVGVLIRFREQPVAIVADIEAMFHQVKVSDKDRDALRFLWWSDGNMEKPPTEYCMTVHLFGATSSPSCAAYSLRCTASENADYFSQETVKTVERNFYVDDLLKSVPDVKVGIELSSELTDILCHGGFKLTKWISNKPEVMDTIPESERAGKCGKVDFESDKQYERALGLQWYVENDTFVFDVDLPDQCHTRRGILSVASSLYDPLGLVAPVTLIPKLILQNACRQKLQWDERMSDADVEKWSQWVEGLPVMSKVSIDRCFQPTAIDNTSSKVELHMFSDASEYAYGAAVYINIYDASRRSKCSLVMGKSRLAPIKAISIPRLELAAAVLAVKLYQLVSQELDLKVDGRYFWTDSMIVLGYIRNETRRFKTFVANRLAVIHDVTSPTDWRYVPSDKNPADIASRGLFPNEVGKLEQWVNGPDFIQKGKNDWPQNPQAEAILDSDSEIKQVHITQGTQVKPVNGLYDMIIRYSNWYALQRSVAWLLRFKSYVISKYLRKETGENCKNGPLSVSELRASTKAILSMVQQSVYSNEISCVRKSGYVSGNGSIAQLSPVFTDDLLKVGGRLENANMHNDSKHQIILPGNHQVTRILIRSYHEANAHMGPHHILSLIRQKYWILPGLKSVKSVVSKCLQCKKQQQRPETQQMGQLPVERLEPDKPPFTYTGVDFFGPMYVKSGRKQLKRYGCLFTCLCTRAVHIEITHSLNTDSFISALQRFESRRGRPEKIFSDNGTNLTAGEKELRESIQTWNQSHISRHCTQKGIAWHFNPPYASHMGGVWERLVRSFKVALKSVVREQILCDEALATLATEVEKVLNDRPITQVSNDHRDPQPLSPNNLLLLRPSMCFPPGLFERDDNYCRRWWRQVQYLANIFWRRWLKEYLPTLQVRQKWHNSRRNLAVNDLVLVCDVTSTRGHWPLGLVQEVSKGRDGLVRSCRVRVNGTVKVRPITKLCLLEQNVV